MASHKNRARHRDAQPSGRRHPSARIVRTAARFGSLVVLLLLLGAVLRKKQVPDEASLRSAVTTPADAGTSQPGPYAGSLACRECHRPEYDRWSTSHHALAEREIRHDLDGAA